MEYYFRVRQDGVPKTGLTPDFEYLLTTGGVCGDGAESGTDKSASAPIIYEVGGGVYKFDIEFGTAPWDVTTQGLVGVIDADPTGAAGLTDDERYIDILLRNETRALMSMSLDSSGRVDLGAVGGTAVTGPSDLRADVSALTTVNNTVNTISSDVTAVSGKADEIISDIAALSFLGSGSVSVNHNYGGADVLTYKTSGGIGIDNAEVRAYLKTDYDAGNNSSSYLKGITTTDVNGQWENTMRLDPGTYTIEFVKQGYYGPDTQEITVS